MTAMHIVISKQDTVVRSLNFDAGVVGLGSDPDVQVYLPDGRIAPRQAELRAVERGWVVEPLDLNHALILNAEVADQETPIKNGDEIRLGDFALKIYLDPDPNEEPVEAALSREVAELRRRTLPPGSTVRREEDIVLAPAARARTTDFALRLSQCTDFAGLLSTVAEVLQEWFDARMVWIGVRRKTYGEFEFVEGRRKDGKTAGDPPHEDTYRYRCVEQGQFLLVPGTGDDDTTSAMALPLGAGHGCLGMLYLDSPAEAVPYDRSHLDELTMFAALIGKRLEGVIAGHVQQQQAAAAGELAFIRAVQARMDPTTVPHWDQLQMAVYCKPGMERTGDMFDVMRLPNGLASILVAHAEAPGVRAALAMAEMRAAFRMAAMHADPPHILLRALNWILRNDRDAGLLHCAAVALNPRNGACEYATAGNIGAVFISDDGDPRVLSDATRKALGHKSEYAAAAQSERLGTGETLALYTPGCRNIMDRHGDRLGEGPLTSALCDGCAQPPVAALDELLTDLGAFFREGRQPEDVTLLFLRRT